MSKTSNKDAVNKALANPYPSFGPLLKAVRKAAKVTAAQYTTSAEIHINSQSNYENSKRDPSIDYLIHFCCTVGASFWQTLYRRVELSGAPEHHKQHIMQELAPFYPHLVASSSNTPIADPSEQSEQDTQPPSEEVISACYDMMQSLIEKPQIKVFKQNGNAMAPTIRDGDTLFVDSETVTLTEGDIFVFELQADQSAKRVQLLPNGGVMLVSDNPNFHPISLDVNEVKQLQVIGKLVTSISNFS